MGVIPAYLPADRSEVTESWLRDTLTAHPTFKADAIESIRLRHLGDGMGQLSTLVLSDVECRSGETRQMVIKLHANIPDMHDIGLRYGHYESEVNFYNRLADDVPIRTPDIYVSTMDPDNQRVLIIMESFADWHSPDQISGASREEITTATEHLAGLTARYWGGTIREQHGWLRNLRSPCYANLPEDYLGCVDITLERIGAGMPDSSERTARRIGGNFRAVMEDQCMGPQALAHWDYRVENLFYGPNDQFAVIDWQLMMVTNPATDLAYLISSNIDTELRRTLERDLMVSYLENLRRAGVADYDLNDLERDYRRALLAVSGIPIIGGSGFDMENQRSKTLFTTLGARMFQAIEDWDALYFMPG